MYKEGGSVALLLSTRADGMGVGTEFSALVEQS